MQDVTAPQAGPKYRPYLEAGAMFQVGLRPFDPAHWIEIGAGHAAFMAAKRQRLHGNPPTFYRALPESLAAQAELRDLLIAHLLKDHPQSFARLTGGIAGLIDGTLHDPDDAGIEPLAFIGNLVEEDFVLLENREGGTAIIAASNAYTSSGRIVSSVGHVMPWAHQHVPLLNQDLGPRIDRVLASLRVGAPLARFNWLLTPIASRLFPAAEANGRAAADVAEVARVLEADPGLAGELLWIRSERQTLLRLPGTGALAFGIYTYSDPLSSLKGDRVSLEAIAALLAAYSDERLAYAAMTPLKRPVLAWLERQLT